MSKSKKSAKKKTTKKAKKTSAKKNTLEAKIQNKILELLGFAPAPVPFTLMQSMLSTLFPGPAAANVVTNLMLSSLAPNSKIEIVKIDGHDYLRKRVAEIVVNAINVRNAMKDILKKAGGKMRSTKLMEAIELQFDDADAVNLCFAMSKADKKGDFARDGLDTLLVS
jgi:hypothetical protein